MLREYDYRLERDVKRLADADEVEPAPAPAPPPPLPSPSGGDASAPDEEEEEVEIVPRCIFTLYGALSPLPDSYTPSLYAEWYSNLFHPTGARIVDPPSSTLSAILASPNCGLVLSVPNAKVTPTQQLWNSATVSGAWLVVVEAVILLLQVRQLERVQDRPGTIANVSHYGIIGMLFVDAYTFVTLLTLGVVFGAFFFPELVFNHSLLSSPRIKLQNPDLIESRKRDRLSCFSVASRRRIHVPPLFAPVRHPLHCHDPRSDARSSRSERTHTRTRTASSSCCWRVGRGRSGEQPDGRRRDDGHAGMAKEKGERVDAEANSKRCVRALRRIKSPDATSCIAD